MLPDHLPLGSKPRRRPQFTRSITVDREGPNRPQEGRLIPWPEVPCYPVLTDLEALFKEPPAGSPEPHKSLTDIGPALLTTAGRTALGWAFKALHLEPGAGILLPAYHCLAMVEPLQWLGLKPVYYRLHEDLSIDYEDLEARLDGNCRTLVAVHYFGFPQDGPHLRAFCDSFGLALVEDCAHSFFGSNEGATFGSFGDYAIGSLPKFFPVQGGGCLVSSRRRLPSESLAAPGRATDLQALVRGLQTAHYYGHLRGLTPLTTGAAAAAKALGLAGFGRPMGDLIASPAGLEFAATRSARKIMRSSAPGEIITRRRQNYEAICRALAGVPGLTLLKPRLEDGVVPYMVPLKIPALRRLFGAMEDRALAMQRFGQFLDPDLDPTLCPISTDLSHHGLQLPCHQALDREEIHWLVEQLADICRQSAAA